VGWERQELFVGKFSGEFDSGKNGKNGKGTHRELSWREQILFSAPRRRHLITGGAGFIGSHLAEALVNAGEEVYIIDNLSTGSMANIEHLIGRKNFHYVIDTIANEPVLAELIDRCDVIYHLAASVGVELIVKQPVRTIETNIFGTEAVLRLAARKGKRVILASSSEVYGKGAQLPFREEGVMVFGPTTKTRWGYACSKAIDEFLALAYWKEHGLPVTVLRYFNTVGPRQVGSYGMVVPRFVKAALRGAPLYIYGDGQQTRCFCYVGDVVRATCQIVDCPVSLGQIYNVGSEEEVTIAELAQKVVELCGSDSPIVHIPYEEAYGEGFEDMRRRVPDLTKIREAIGYQPTLKLEEILQRIIAYHAERSLVRQET